MSAPPPAKRPRHSGSFSPPSPPYHHHQAKPVSNPRTPISPTSSMAATSTSNLINTVTSDYAANSTTSTSIAAKDGDGDALMTDEVEPSNNADINGNSNGIGNSNNANEGDQSRIPTIQDVKDEEDDEHKTDNKNPNGINDGNENGNEIGKGKSKENSSGGSGGNGSSSNSSGSQKRSDHDLHTQAQANAEAIAERLNADTTPLYKLGSRVVTLSRPHASQNLISLYNLDEMAASVRRVDPDTGEKINKIRKSYEGKIKALRIAGRNKAVSNANEFYPSLLVIPDDDWYATKVMGKEIEKGLGPAFAAKLDRALNLGPGRLPDREADKWMNLIGTADDVPPPLARPATDSLASAVTAAAAAAVKKQQQATPTVIPGLAQQHTQLPGSQQQSSQSIARPERAGTKRRYNEASFKGYGEGYADDDMGEVSEDDGQRGTGTLKKKRRKEVTYNVPSSTTGAGTLFRFDAT